MHLYQKTEMDSKEEKILKRAQNSEVKKVETKKDIVVKGIDDIKLNIASCCNPVPGDSIVGYITKGYGITVHRANCPNVSNLEERIIDVSWNQETVQKYTATLLIKTLGNDTILLEVIAKISSNNVTVQSIVNLGKGKTIELTVLVSSLEELKKLMNDIDMMNDVLCVERKI